MAHRMWELHHGRHHSFPSRRRKQLEVIDREWANRARHLSNEKKVEDAVAVRLRKMDRIRICSRHTSRSCFPGRHEWVKFYTDESDERDSRSNSSYGQHCVATQLFRWLRKTSCLASSVDHRSTERCGRGFRRMRYLFRFFNFERGVHGMYKLRRWSYSSVASIYVSPSVTTWAMFAAAHRFQPATVRSSPSLIRFV
jgi:hypothetical protein